VSVDLSKVDLVRERMRVTYDEARAALEQANGDVIAALAHLERSKQTSGATDLIAVTADLLDEVQRLLDAGVIRKIRVKLGNRTLKEIPVSLTAAGALVIGLVAVLVTRFVIELERDNEITS
jgi:cell division protein ZapA (FtsZ GTPase activity inhibitor)